MAISCLSRKHIQCQAEVKRSQTHSHWDTQRQNETVAQENTKTMARQPKYTDPHPWGVTWKGIVQGGHAAESSAPKAARPPLCRWQKAASFPSVSPWLRVCVFGLLGQVIKIFTTLLSRLSMGVPTGTRLSPSNVAWDNHYSHEQAYG